MNNLINCLFYEQELLNKLSIKIEELKALNGVTPSLATILVGSNPASEIYVKNKTRKAIKLGIKVTNYKLKEAISEKELLDLIEELNNNQSINAVLLQMPLPKHLNSQKIINYISPLKDVDGLHSLNAGFLLAKNYHSLIPCTPLAILYVLKKEISLAGKNAVIVGRSNLVGLPTALLLLHENATVTICHSNTQNLESICQKADIIVAAIGKPEFIAKNYIKSGAIVIDVGINRVTKQPHDFKNEVTLADLKATANNSISSTLVTNASLENKKNTPNEQPNYTIVGDVNTNDALSKNARVTPVPKGIGKLTVAFLLYNTYKATLKQYNLPDDSYDIFF